MLDPDLLVQCVWTRRKVLGGAYKILLHNTDNFNKFSHFTLGEVQVGYNFVFLFHKFKYFSLNFSTGVLFLPWGYDFGEFRYQI
jgi:hypothetical protein